MSEPGFTGDIEFSYFAYDRPGAYPQMAWARLSYENASGAPSLVNDRFLLLDMPVVSTDLDDFSVALTG